MRGLVAGLFFACCCQAFAEGSRTPAPARLPFKQSAEQDDATMYRALSAFFAACAVAGGLVYGIRRYGVRLPGMTAGSRSAKKVHCLQRMEAIRLTQKTTLFVIRYRGEELLIAEGERGVQVLANGPKPDLPVENSID
jgi:hypothetical protein